MIEDNPSEREGLCRLVELSGFEATAAEDGVVALQMIEREKFDLLLVDIAMPRMDGLVGRQYLAGFDERCAELHAISILASQAATTIYPTASTLSVAIMGSTADCTAYSSGKAGAPTIARDLSIRVAPSSPD